METAWREEVEQKRRRTGLTTTSSMRTSGTAVASPISSSLSPCRDGGGGEWGGASSPREEEGEEEDKGESRLGTMLSALTRRNLPLVHRARQSQPSLSRVLIRFYGCRCIVPALLKVLYDCLVFVGPVMLHRIITFLGECQHTDNPE